MTGYVGVMESHRKVHLNRGEVKYALLPVWLLSTKWNDQNYLFAMNGQTGKMVGDIPYSKKKAVLLWIVLFVITFIIMCLFTYFV